jgi:hypothetical protein
LYLIYSDIGLAQKAPKKSRRQEKCQKNCKNSHNDVVYRLSGFNFQRYEISQELSTLISERLTLQKTQMK